MDSKFVMVPREPSDEMVVNALCDGSQRWTMSVPARVDSDPDLVISDALMAAREALSAPAPAAAAVSDEWNRAIESAARVCDSRELRAHTKSAAACYRLCAQGIRALTRPAPADAEPGPMARCTCATSGPDYCEVHAS